jgi:hypothetical protein
MNVMRHVNRLPRGHIGEDGVFLEGTNHPAPGDAMHRLTRDLGAFEKYLSRAWCLETSDEFE